MEDTIINLLIQGITFLMGTSVGPYVVAALAILGALVTIASVIVPFTVTPKDDEILGKIKAVWQRFSVLKPKV